MKEPSLRQVTAELRVQKEWFRVTISSIGDAVLAVDTQARVTFLNPIAEALTGWSQSEAQGRPLEEVFQIINERTRRSAENPVQRALEEGRVVGLANHTILIAKDGKERAIDDSAAPIFDAEGQLIGVVLVFRDITERRRAEMARLHLAALVDSSDDAIYSKSPDGIVQSWNRGAARLYGYRADEIIGKSVAILDPPEGAAELVGIMAKINRGERVGHIETVRRRKDGTLVHVSVTLSPIQNEEGEIIGISSIGRDITSRTQLEDALRRNAEQLAEADRRKDEFLATLAHELRNPLAPLRSCVHIIRHSLNDPHAMQHCLGVMERQFRQLVRLVDELLDLSRLTRGRVELRKEAIELGTVIASAVEISRPLIEQGGHDLHISMPAEPTPLDADPVRLAQVFANLLNNAAKYTERGGQIWLTGERLGGEVRIHVRDTGIGIRAEDLPRVFEMFAQVDRSLERAQGGLGIGLALVRGLVEMHGGTVEAVSPGLDHGSTFTVRLPVATAAAPTPPPTKDKAEPDRARRRILVVDDNHDANDILAFMLTKAGHEVRAAYNGQAALDVAPQFRPEVILLDIGMPGMNGYEVARRLRAQPTGRDVLLVALTGWGQEADKRHAKEAGFDIHMTKPIEPGMLRKIISDLPAAPQGSQ